MLTLWPGLHRTQYKVESGLAGVTQLAGQDVVDQTDADFRNKNQAMETSGVANRLDIFLLYSLTGYCLSLPDHLEMDPQPTPPSPPLGAVAMSPGVRIFWSILENWDH